MSSGTIVPLSPSQNDFARPWGSAERDRRLSHLFEPPSPPTQWTTSPPIHAGDSLLKRQTHTYNRMHQPEHLFSPHAPQSVVLAPLPRAHRSSYCPVSSDVCAKGAAGRSLALDKLFPFYCGLHVLPVALTVSTTPPTRDSPHVAIREGRGGTVTKIPRQKKCPPVVVGRTARSAGMAGGTSRVLGGTVHKAVSRSWVFKHLHGTTTRAPTPPACGALRLGAMNSLFGFWGGCSSLILHEQVCPFRPLRPSPCRVHRGSAPLRGLSWSS